jgi:hypothetical protein
MIRRIVFILIISGILINLGCAEAPGPEVNTYNIGFTVEKRHMTVTQIGKGRNLAIYLVAGIHGEEGNTSELLKWIRQRFTEKPSLVPPGVRLYILAEINPDGLSKQTRLNSHNVDLNRNFPTPSWKKDAVSPAEVFPESGGKKPGSEPETKAVMGWLTKRVKPWVSRVWLLSYHAAYPETGAVQAGYRIYGKAEAESARIARMVSKLLGYEYIDTWITDMPLTGELLNWCELNNIRSADIELPDYDSPELVPGNRQETTLKNHIRMIDSLLKQYKQIK